MGFLRHYAFQVAGALIATAALVVDVFRSTSSTAPIGLLLVPFAAAVGAFAGDSLKYFLDLARKKRPHSPAKTAIIVAALAFCAVKAAQIRSHDQSLLIAASPATPGPELIALLEKNDARIIHAVAANPALPAADLNRLAEAHLTDYYVMSGAVTNPGLSAEMKERVASLERSDFAGDAEYEVYQAQVWSRLLRRKDISEGLVHKLASKKAPEHFLILALLESPYTTCEEKRHFLPQSNTVLESAIRRSMESQKCE